MGWIFGAVVFLIIVYFLARSPELARTKDADRLVVEAVGEVSGKLGAPRSQIALAWLLAKPEVTAPIVGVSKPQNLKDAISAMSLKLDNTTIKALEAPYVPHPVLGIR